MVCCWRTAPHRTQRCATRTCLSSVRHASVPPRWPQPDTARLDPVPGNQRDRASPPAPCAVALSPPGASDAEVQGRSRSCRFPSAGWRNFTPEARNPVLIGFTVLELYTVTSVEAPKTLLTLLDGRKVKEDFNIRRMRAAAWRGGAFIAPPASTRAPIPCLGSSAESAHSAV